MALKVTFDDPSAGWVGVTIKNDEDEVRVVGSYTPHDSFLDLVDALQAMLEVEGPRRVTWNEEPPEFDLCFEKCSETTGLAVWQFRDHRRPKGSGTKRLEVSGSYREICLPFWRALRGLQGRRTPEELREGWHREFPLEELDRLTAAIEKASLR